jgi:hypothetical protein
VLVMTCRDRGGVEFQAEFVRFIQFNMRTGRKLAFSLTDPDFIVRETESDSEVLVGDVLQLHVRLYFEH